MEEKEKTLSPAALRRGYLYCIFAGAAWGFSGVCGQFLFDQRLWSVDFIIPLRMLLAGAVMLLVAAGVEGRAGFFSPFSTRRNGVDLLIFAILGLGLCQYSYYTTIREANATTATILCYLGPVLIIVWQALRARRLPAKNELLAVALAVFVYILWEGSFPLAWGAGLAVLMVAAYAVLTVARSHDVAYLNGIFEMKNESTPIFITQPYMYIANNYENFNYLVEHLEQFAWGMRSLFPLWALTGLKFVMPSLANYPILVNKEELTTVTLFYDAYYDFGAAGVILLSGILGAVSFLLMRKLSRMQNPVDYLFYAQIGVYLSLSFFTTWFSNPTTWFYLAVTAALWLYCRIRRGRG